MKGKKWNKIRAGETGHIMNNDESTCCRHLMAVHGLTEEELRADKKFRKILSEAQKSGESGKLSKQERAIYNVVRMATKELKLAKEHPDVIAKCIEIWNDRSKGWRWSWAYRDHNPFHQTMYTRRNQHHGQYITDIFNKIKIRNDRIN